jgi:ATP-dependent DNA helicase RecQ
MTASLEQFLERCVFLDLEVHRNGRLAQIGAVCGPHQFEWSGGTKEARREALDDLDRFIAKGDARFLAGHNLLAHDWPILQQLRPGLRLLRLPVVDTLFLSPLAFPEVPYHALVKDYRLVKDSVNDPVADARLSVRVFCDQWQAFAEQTARGETDLLSLLRFCLTDPMQIEGRPQGNGDAPKTRNPKMGQAPGVHAPEPVPFSAQRLRTDGLMQFFDQVGARPLDAAAAQTVFERLAADRVCISSMPGLIAELAESHQLAALAYVAAWLGVSGGSSVLPPWVRRVLPETVRLVHRLRSVPCGDPCCNYCCEVHDPIGQLERYFGFDRFRAQPAAEDGGSLQEAIVRCSMADQPLLAILPTGGGKSLCYQLPALVRHQRRGALTVVLSPLQALMKDQVDNFAAKTGHSSAAAINGLLTLPERGDVQERVRLGRIALLYVSPEQLRNKSTIDALKHREIGCWVFDEAHCLSKWGHDFRPDYLYAARFIRELSEQQQVPPPPVQCFTATAKTDVVEEIVKHFQQELKQDLQLFEGGIERENLRFEVQPTPAPEKFARVHELLDQRLGDDGSAVVYVATRKGAERLAEYLAAQGWLAVAFHAGLKPPDKRRIQDEFIAGQVRVICATNAFGMGIDKEDVRIVVHADMPGSLENYLQEAGRAGRDRAPADCVLLYSDDDAETQFALSAISQLTPRDIRQLLRGLRRKKRKSELLVITSGELLRDDEVETSFDSQDKMADTKVKTAVAWLERAGFLERQQNATRVYQGKPQVESLENAERRIDRMGLPYHQRRQWLAILQVLMNTEGPESLTIDRLAELPEFQTANGQPSAAHDDVPADTLQVLRALDGMTRAGLIRKGISLSAYVRYRIDDDSIARLRSVAAIETALLQVMQEQEPDAEQHDWLHVSLRRLNQALQDRGVASSPELIRKLLDSLSRDGRGFAASRGSLEFRAAGKDQYRLKLHRNWALVTEISQRRRDVAEVVLRAILAQVPDGTAASDGLLVEFSSEDLTQAVERSPVLHALIKDPLAAIDRGLMYLHEQDCLILEHGLSIFRQAMTIRLLSESKGRRYTQGDFDPLHRHYQERILQVHVMCEYARRGIESIKQGLQMVLAYFQQPRAEFLNDHFADRQEMLQRAITHEAYQQIVDDLHHPTQQAVVAAAPEDNLLILAGPGSGKTRVVVHRVAFLVRVQRVPAQQVLVLCFNRLAAIQLKRRLRELIGPAAAHVTVLTYHALAARLTGTSFAPKTGLAPEHGCPVPVPFSQPLDLSELIPAATRILRGEQPVPGVEADQVRDRLLAGYRYVLVDEYQDIDQQQYELISALTDRTGQDDDARLSILAVGDDDQNIYTFRGANVEFIRRFQSDYHAHLHCLLENYRSTAHIIAAANRLIAHNRDRMKTDREIRINAARQNDPPGGLWERLDPVARGRVQVLRPTGGQHEAELIVDELLRLSRLSAPGWELERMPAAVPEYLCREAPDPMPYRMADSVPGGRSGGFDWSACAVLARTRAALQAIRAACEHFRIPVVWGLDTERPPRLHRVREIARLLDWLQERRHEVCCASQFPWPEQVGNPWHQLLTELLEQWRDESGDTPLPVGDAIDFFYEALAEQRLEARVGRGVFLATAHAAKGMEFDHVLIPGTAWTRGNTLERQEEERRLFYVAMTRARQTLTLTADRHQSHPHLGLIRGDGVLERTVADGCHVPAGILQRSYETLGPADLDLGFPGSFFHRHPIHAALEQLEPGSPLQLESRDEHVVLTDPLGRVVARLSQAARAKWRDRLDAVLEARVVAILQRHRTDDQPEYRDRTRCDRWEIPQVEVVTTTRCSPVA